MSGLSVTAEDGWEMWNAVDMRAGGCYGLGTTRTMPAGSFTQDGDCSRHQRSGDRVVLCCGVTKRCRP